ncbi:cornifelin homolog A-like [Pantherophis guttatus]|uniref:Cornifelin homolog A-like n=1 Tax=Pantherophis guttatus TaxID=94885 RepID=A0A6P9DE56_PANGU|nr:cornifelin homolog A-like [Pantherophis guttatus]
MAFRSFPAVPSQPCTTQPCTTQPSASNPSSCRAPYRDWKSDLTDCCVDKQICICGTFAPCVLACQVATGLGECCCLPLLPGAMVAARTALREQLRIEGDVCRDWLATCCCCPCAMCQMAREMKNPC